MVPFTCKVENQVILGNILYICGIPPANLLTKGTNFIKTYYYSVFNILPTLFFKS